MIWRHRVIGERNTGASATRQGKLGHDNRPQEVTEHELNLRGGRGDQGKMRAALASYGEGQVISVHLRCLISCP